MKAFLMQRDQDFDLDKQLPSNAEALTQDLELNTLFRAMSGDDQFLFDVARKAVLLSLNDPEAIVYRQQALADCLAQPVIVRQIYDIAVEAIQAERKIWGFWAKSPDSVLSRSVQVVELFVGYLHRLRKIADADAGRFTSEAFVRFFAMLASELDDAYFQTLEAQLRELQFRRGVMLDAHLGIGNKGANFVLRRPQEQRWIERIVSYNRSGNSFQIAERDESGLQALADLRGNGINLAANALAQSTDHILSFFTRLRTELGFYVGCVNLRALLLKKGEPLCFPVPVAQDTQAFSAQGLYEVCLSLRLAERAVGNEVHADNKPLVIITGANQGGKSTFLRSVGVAQLMMQSGMFAPAKSFTALVRNGVFTHYKREEDPSMKSGKLDEELSRMSAIADKITTHCLLLCNESFASTNEKEGSEIARQVVQALVDAGVTVFFVTHLFDFAEGFYRQKLDSALFLRAERLPDSRRTYRFVVGEPLPTSYGEDTYKRIFSQAG